LKTLFSSKLATETKEAAASALVAEAAAQAEAAKQKAMKRATAWYILLIT